MTKGTKNAAVSNDDSENSDNELKEAPPSQQRQSERNSMFNVFAPTEQKDVDMSDPATVAKLPRVQRMTLEACPEISDMQVGETTKKTHPLMVSPNATGRFVWDMVSLLIIGVETVTVPMILAFPDMSMPL